MAITVVPQQDLGERIGQGLGQGLGAGVSSGFEKLANLKLQDYSMRQQAALQQQIRNQQIAQKTQAYESILGKGNPLAGLLAQSEPSEAKALLDRLEGLNIPMAGQPSVQQKQAGQPGVQQGQGIEPGQQPPEQMRFGASPAERRHREKLAARMSETEFKKAQYYDKRSEPDYIKEKGKSEAAQENQMRFDRMKELIESNELTNPLEESLISGISHGIFGFGIDISSLGGASSEEFRKLSNDMVKNIKEIFGGKITNLDLEQFLKTIPTLRNSRDGKLRIIRNLELLGKANTEKFKIMTDIMDENDGMRPKNFDSLVQKRFDPVIKQISKEFKEGVKKDYLNNPLKLKRTPEQKQRQNLQKDINEARFESYLEGGGL